MQPMMAAETLVLTSEECRHITRYEPAPGVDYEPGVDAHGREVVPADLTDNRMELPSNLTIDLTALVFELLEREPPQGLRDSTISLGKVVIHESGLISYNGKPLGDTYQNAIAQACLERGFR